MSTTSIPEIPHRKPLYPLPEMFVGETYTLTNRFRPHVMEFAARVTLIDIIKAEQWVNEKNLRKIYGLGFKNPIETYHRYGVPRYVFRFNNLDIIHTYTAGELDLKKPV